jgi:hypothetical protein
MTDDRRRSSVIRHRSVATAATARAISRTGWFALFLAFTLFWLPVFRGFSTTDGAVGDYFAARTVYGIPVFQFCAFAGKNQAAISTSEFHDLNIFNPK